MQILHVTLSHSSTDLTAKEEQAKAIGRLDAAIKKIAELNSVIITTIKVSPLKGATKTVLKLEVTLQDESGTSEKRASWERFLARECYALLHKRPNWEDASVEVIDPVIRKEALAIRRHYVDGDFRD